LRGIIIIKQKGRF